VKLFLLLIAPEPHYDEEEKRVEKDDQQNKDSSVVLDFVNHYCETVPFHEEGDSKDG